MAIKNAQYNVDNGNGYDTYHFETNEDMITGVFQRLTDTGFRKLPGGLIIQWGKIGIDNNLVDFIATFPVSFPSVCISVFVSIEGRDNNWNGRGYGHALSQDRCRIVVKDNDSTYHNCVNWLAIGY